jgi:hypothetical protein
LCWRKAEASFEKTFFLFHNFRGQWYVFVNFVAQDIVENIVNHEIGCQISTPDAKQHPRV